MPSASLSVRGHVDHATTPRRIIAATDAAETGRYVALAYLSNTGQYRLHADQYPRYVSGPARSDVCELRAIAYCVRDLFDPHNPTPVHVLTDSSNALSYATRWQAGQLDLPPGYRADRNGGRTAALVTLAHTLRDHPEVTVERITGHAGHPLNETADSLCKLGLRTMSAGWNDRKQARHLAAQWAQRGYDEHAATHRSPTTPD